MDESVMMPRLNLIASWDGRRESGLWGREINLELVAAALEQRQAQLGYANGSGATQKRSIAPRNGVYDRNSKPTRQPLISAAEAYEALSDDYEVTLTQGSVSLEGPRSCLALS